MRRSRHNIIDPRDVPLCTRCLQPYDPLAHFCPHCGCTVGQLTPYMPFVSIPFNVDLLSSLWRRIWADDAHPMTRAFCTVLVLLCAPILLIGLPFILVNLVKTGRKEPRGFDVLVETEQKLADGLAAKEPRDTHLPGGLSGSN